MLAATPYCLPAASCPWRSPPRASAASTARFSIRPGLSETPTAPNAAGEKAPGWIVRRRSRSYDFGVERHRGAAAPPSAIDPKMGRRRTCRGRSPLRAPAAGLERPAPRPAHPRELLHHWRRMASLLAFPRLPQQEDYRDNSLNCHIVELLIPMYCNMSESPRCSTARSNVQRPR